MAAELDPERVEEAKRLIIAAQRASTVFLQTQMKVGHTTATRILTALEEAGVLERVKASPETKGSPWKVLVLPEGVDSLEAVMAKELSRAQDVSRELRKHMVEVLTDEERRELGPHKVKLMLDLVCKVEVTPKAEAQTMVCLQDKTFKLAFLRIMALKNLMALPMVFDKTRIEAAKGEKWAIQHMLEQNQRRPVGGKMLKEPDPPETRSEEQLDQDLAAAEEELQNMEQEPAPENPPAEDPEDGEET